jgi:hypothetical protein
MQSDGGSPGSGARLDIRSYGGIAFSNQVNTGKAQRNSDGTRA